LAIPPAASLSRSDLKISNIFGWIWIRNPNEARVWDLSTVLSFRACEGRPVTSFNPFNVVFGARNDTRAWSNTVHLICSFGEVHATSVAFVRVKRNATEVSCTGFPLSERYWGLVRLISASNFQLPIIAGSMSEGEGAQFFHGQVPVFLR
jgi:hypothetical protein